MGSAFGLTLTAHGDSGCIELKGDFDAECRDRLEDKLKEAERRHIRHLIFDLRGLGDVDGAGMELLLAGTSSRADGIEPILVRVPHHLRGLVEATGLESVLPIAYDRQPS